MPSRQPPTPELQLSWAQVLGARLRAQHLAPRVGVDRSLETVSLLAGLHAQVMSSAELTLAARVDGLAPGQVARWLWDERVLVKTWTVRGTLHLVPADELPLWVAALSTERRWEKPSWQKAFGVSPEQLQTILDAIESALDGRQLTREELAAEVARRVGDPALGEAVRGSWGAMLKPAAFTGRLCFAPGEGQFVRFTDPRSWLGSWQDVDPDEALRELTRRYLAAYGPAPREDLARWLGRPPALAGRLLRSLGDEVVPVEIEGTAAWGLRASAEALVADPPDGVVRLLPGFDQYVVAGPRSVEAVLPAAQRDRVFRPQGWISPVLIVDGRIVGVWRFERNGGRRGFRLQPFEELSPDVVAAARSEAARLAAY